jgi:hypothetical protein
MDLAAVRFGGLEANGEPESNTASIGAPLLEWDE